jgi:Arc/MetJ-type ribon-helix-helix transcriptional regulator
VRKSITLPKSMLLHAMNRSQNFGNFSEYVRHLVEKDLSNSSQSKAESTKKDD